MKSLIEQLEETNRKKGIQVMLYSEVMSYAEKEGGQKHPIACFVNREKWAGLTIDQQEAFAIELMQKNWGEIATYRMNVEE